MIGGILLRNREAENYFKVFYLRRAFRILPLYFALLAAFFAIRFGLPMGADASFDPGQIPFWSYPLLVQNFHMAFTGAWGPGPLGVTWSVAIEEQFYLFLPLLIRWVPPRAQLRTFILLAISGPVFRIYAPVPAATFLLSGSLDLFFSGVILAWFFEHYPATFKSPTCRLLAMMIFAAGGLGMAWLAVRGGFGHFRETVITFFWGAFLWLVLSFMGTRLTAPLRWKPLCWVGGISYGVYLLHVFISHLVFQGVFGALPTEAQGLPGFLLTCGCLALILLVTHLSARYFERPLTALGHRFAYLSTLDSQLSTSPTASSLPSRKH